MWRTGSAAGLPLAAAIMVMTIIIMTGCESSSIGAKNTPAKVEQTKSTIEVVGKPTSIPEVPQQKVSATPKPTLSPTPSPGTSKSTPSPTPFPVADLAFIRDGNLWLASIKSGTQSPLTTDGGNSSPVWCPDGSCLAFVHTVGPASELQRIRVDGSDRRRLVGGDALYTGPRFSPSGDALMYVVKRDTNKDAKVDERDISEIWLANADGSGPRRIVEGTDPAWAPEGLRIAFATSGKLESDAPYQRTNSIDVVNREGKNQWTLVSTGAVPAEITMGGSKLNPGIFLLRSPAWSPTSKQIAFTEVGHTGAIATISERATELRTWAANYEGGFGRAIWSPVGERLAYESFPASGVKGLAIASSPAAATAIGGARSGLSVWLPSWSPDGHLLAFAQESGTKFIGLVSASGEDLRQVASGNVSDPQWNPRSR